jgi:hypothetical protein
MMVVAVILPLEDAGRSLTAGAIENRAGIDKIWNVIAQSHLIAIFVNIDESA